MTIPTYLSYFIAAGTVAVLITIFYGLNRALADARWPRVPTTSSPWAKGTYVGSCNPTRVIITYLKIAGCCRSDINVE